jgi:hypothetical protein
MFQQISRHTYNFLLKCRYVIVNLRRFNSPLKQFRCFLVSKQA